MQKYFNNVINSSGKPVVGASIAVSNYPSGTTATIYSDNGVTQTTNPLTSDVNGQFSFYAADGRYTLAVTANGQVQYQFNDVILLDPADGSQAAVFASLQVTGATTLASTTAVPAGGALGLQMSTTAGLGVYFGSGAPTVSAKQGSLYVRTDGSSTSTRFYVNTNGTTGWTNVVTAA